MARAEEAIRRFSMASMASTVYMDHFIDVSDIPTSNVLYDFSLTSSQEDMPSSPLVPLTTPTGKSPRKKKTSKAPSVERLYFCNECGATFSNSSNLKSHLRTHTGEKPYSCDICGIAFVQSSNLKAHKRVHTGEKPFKCLECGKAFARSSHLVGHKRIHTGEQPYACAVCSRSFASSTQLRKHTDKHNETDSYVCPICDKSFSKSTSLTIHLRIHTGERPYVCVECTAAFRSREDLNVHRKLHSGEVYPYSCRRCGRGFKIKLCCEKHAEKCIASPNKKGKSRKRKYFRGITKRKNPLEAFVSDLGQPPEKTQSQLFQFTAEDQGLCKMEMLEGSIEDGIENEVEEQTMVLTNDGENSVLQVIKNESVVNTYRDI